ncbi:hypothetical protein ACFS4T_27560 [Pseudomonas lini]
MVLAVVSITVLVRPSEVCGLKLLTTDFTLKGVADALLFQPAHRQCRGIGHDGVSQGGFVAQFLHDFISRIRSEKYHRPQQRLALKTGAAGPVTLAAPPPITAPKAPALIVTANVTTLNASFLAPVL